MPTEPESEKPRASPPWPVVRPGEAGGAQAVGLPPLHRIDPVQTVHAISSGRIKAARAVAIAADIVQIGLFPLFAEGFISPFDDALDVAVGVTLTWLVGWHLAFLPSFVVKLAPGLDLVPTWTVAVFIATRNSPKPPQSPSVVVH